MRVMVFVKATADSEAGVNFTRETTAMFEAMGKFNEALAAAGILQDGDGLKPTSAGKRIAFDGAARTVIEGPFAPPDAQVAGYWIWKVRDMDEAVEWAKRCPNPMPGPSELEIRPYYELEDFAGALPPDAVEQAERLRGILDGDGGRSATLRESDNGK